MRASGLTALPDGDQEQQAGGRRRPWELVLLLGIVALAAWLRLRQLGLVEFKLDETVAVNDARQILHGHLPTVGLTSSLGALNPPLFLYLTALPLLIRDDPLAATAFVGVLAVIAAALTFFVLRPRFGALAAFAASALFATAPWAVLYGRKVWAQDMLPVFTVSLLWSLFLVLERRRTRTVLLVPVFLCITFQLNFSAIALAVPVVAVLAYRARAVHWPAFAAGVAVAILLLAPWLSYEARHGFEDVVTLVTQGHGDNRSAVPGPGSIAAVRETTRVIGALGWDYVAGSSRALFQADAGPAWTLGRVASFIAIALLALGLVTSATRIVRSGRLSRRWPFVELDAEGGRRALLLVWLGGIWLSFATTAHDRVFPHYLIVTYPVSFAVQALGLADLVANVRSRRRVAEIAGIAVLAVMVTGYVAFTLAFHRFLDKDGGTAGDYGVVYRDKADLARIVRERGLRVADDPVLDFLVAGAMEGPTGSQRLVPVRNSMGSAEPLSCDGDLRSFGPLSVCLPAQP
jgi:4-amino-4-deoxy-L-arabinose transferase-like glycosyltransferase